MTIGGLGVAGMGGAAMARVPPRRRPGASGFGLPMAPGTAAPAASGAVSMPSLLGLQECLGDAAGDREARMHADEMLDVLGGLQRGLLSGEDAGPGLDRLARLARQAPRAADPGLAAVQRALLLRVAVERARARAAASS